MGERVQKTDKSRSKSQARRKAVQAKTTSLVDETRKPKRPEYLKGLLFGPPKTGKTTAVATGPRPLIIETDPGGDDVLAGKDVDILRPVNWAATNSIVERLHGVDSGYWETVVLDSATFLFELFAGKTINKAHRENQDVRRFYGKGGAAVNDILMSLLALPAHVLITAHVVIVDSSDVEGMKRVNPELGRYQITPAVSPMVNKILLPAVSFMGRTFKRYEYDPTTKLQRARYYVSFDDGNKSPASQRKLGLPAEVENFDLNRLLAERG